MPKTKTETKPQERRHSQQFNLRVTPEQDELIREAAEFSGQSVSDWLRGLALREARRLLGR
jgi:uncharacterized protein (DUF1778 family)